MRSNRGFTLVETLVATAVLVPGLAAVTMLLPYLTNSISSSRQITAATMILTDKMEALRRLPLTDAALNVGGGLNPASPVNGYYDYVTVAANGTVTTSATALPKSYLRVWQTSGANPKTITIIIYSVRNAVSNRRMEMARSSTIVTDTF
jgi:prepilin-type N-terminal cleavage/methylation domain-containing protein